MKLIIFNLLRSSQSLFIIFFGIFSPLRCLFTRIIFQSSSMYTEFSSYNKIVRKTVLQLLKARKTPLPNSCFLCCIFCNTFFLFLHSVVIPAKDFVVVKMEVFSNSEPLSANLTGEALDVICVFRGPHYKFEGCYWLVTCSAHTGDTKQPVGRTISVTIIVNQGRKSILYVVI